MPGKASSFLHQPRLTEIDVTFGPEPAKRDLIQEALGQPQSGSQKKKFSEAGLEAVI